MKAKAKVSAWGGMKVLFRVEVDPDNEVGARLLLPFTQRAEHHPDPERVMRDGLAFLADFCHGGQVLPDEEAALMVAARNYLDRNYPTAVAA